MNNITNPESVENLKQIIAETIINKSGGALNKIAPLSGLSGISYGIAKVGQKAMKDISLIEGLIYPDSAVGDQLDFLAQKKGIYPRFSSSKSSTFLRLVGEEGTIYLKSTHTFITDEGIVFELAKDVTIGISKFTYAKVNSTTEGESTNVGHAEIIKMPIEPNGHIYVINEFKATGGRDVEQDEDFRRRIKENVNILAKSTLSSIEQAFININSNVYKVFNIGIGKNGKVELAIFTQNGVELSIEELDELLEKGRSFFNMVDYKPYKEDFFGVNLVNAEIQTIDISIRVELFDNIDVDKTISDMQSAFSRALDPRKVQNMSKIEWDDLLQIAKDTKGVKYVSDGFFTPSVDIPIEQNKFPRVRGFLVLDLNGKVIKSSNQNLNPIFYPNESDLNFSSTVLRNL